MELLTIGVVVLIALFFGYTNGFHDAANAIATSISTQSLTPRIALAMAAVMNFVGAFLGVEVAATVADTVVVPADAIGLALVTSALIGAITWNLVTWWFGLPSSSTQALIGGLVGAALVAGVEIRWVTVVDRVLLPMVISPVVGFFLAFAGMVVLLRLVTRANPSRANRGFRLAQTGSAAAMALGHGIQDAAKTMGVVFLALVATGHAERGDPMPMWVMVAAATAISLGTWSGGWRIIRTLGRRIIDLDPPRGFMAETVAAAVLYLTAAAGAPVSTTYTITATITGVGATKRLSAVRWGVARAIVVAWIVTVPAAAVVAAVAFGLLAPLR